MLSRGARRAGSVLTGGQWLAALAVMALAVFTGAAPAGAMTGDNDLGLSQDSHV